MNEEKGDLALTLIRKTVNSWLHACGDAVEFLLCVCPNYRQKNGFYTVTVIMEGPLKNVLISFFKHI